MFEIQILCTYIFDVTRTITRNKYEPLIVIFLIILLFEQRLSYDACECEGERDDESQALHMIES
jgi:hypothetical protein